MGPRLDLELKFQKNQKSNARATDVLLGVGSIWVCTAGACTYTRYTYCDFSMTFNMYSKSRCEVRISGIEFTCPLIARRDNDFI
jgi:hypothetical protein